MNGLLGQTFVLTQLRFPHTGQVVSGRLTCTVSLNPTFLSNINLFEDKDFIRADEGIIRVHPKAKKQARVSCTLLQIFY